MMGHQQPHLYTDGSYRPGEPADTGMPASRLDLYHKWTYLKRSQALEYWSRSEHARKSLRLETVALPKTVTAAVDKAFDTIAEKRMKAVDLAQNKMAKMLEATARDVENSISKMPKPLMQTVGTVVKPPLKLPTDADKAERVQKSLDAALIECVFPLSLSLQPSLPLVRNLRISASGPAEPQG
jgi:hypothetical protein